MGLEQRGRQPGPEPRGERNVRASESEARNLRAFDYAKTLSFRTMAASLHTDLTRGSFSTKVRSIIPVDDKDLVSLAKVVAETSLSALGLTPFIELKLADAQGLDPQLTHGLSVDEIDDRRAVIGYSWKPEAALTSSEKATAGKKLQAFQRDANYAHDALIAEHMDVSSQIARKYKDKGVDIEDLISVGNMRLVTCADRFDWRRNIPFAAFIRPHIEGEIKRYFRDKSREIRIKRSIYENTPRVLREVEEIQARGGKVTYAEVAKATKLPEKVVREILNDAGPRSTQSLSELTISGRSVEETLGEVERGFEDVINADTVKALFSLLEPKEQEILRLRFFADMSQQQIADELGISQMHVSRLIARILAKLKGALLDEARDSMPLN